MHHNYHNKTSRHLHPSGSFCFFFLVLILLTLDPGNGEDVPAVALSSAILSFDSPIMAMALAEEDSATEEPPGVVRPTEKKECRKFIMLVAKRLMKYLTNCIHVLKADHPGKGQFDKYFQCAIKCAMKNVEMIDENDRFSNTTMVHFMSKHIGEEYHNLVYRLTYYCTLEHGPKITGEGDPLCLTYGNFINIAPTLTPKCENILKSRT